MKMTHKRILDIYKAGTTGNVIVEYFDMKKNIKNTEVRKIFYTPRHKEMEGYIIWEATKKDISALLRRIR